MKKLLAILALLPLVAAAQTNYPRIGYQGILISQVVGAITNYTPAAPTENTLTNGVAASWTMDQTGTGADTNRLDSSPNGRNLTMAGTVTNQTGVVSNSAAFYGNAANHLYVADNDAWSATGGKSLTVGVWFLLHNTNDTGQVFIAKRGTSSSTYEWSMSYDKTGNNVYATVWTNTSGGLTSAAEVARNQPLNTWQWGLLEIDNTNKLASFWNGTSGTVISAATNTFAGFGSAGTGINTSSTLWLSKTQSGTPMNGRLDNITIWNRLLTPAEKTNWITAKQYPFD